jgi:Mrp family chromosome partitioning ATPase
MSRTFEMLRLAKLDQALLNRAPSASQTNSQNFEVLHLAGKDEQLFDTTACPAATQAGPVPPPPAGAFRGETFKLVQQLFLAGGCEAPRALVFCAVEQGNERNGICARAAELLASHTGGSICVVDANVNSPYLHKCFKVENGPGFRAAMVEADPVKNYTQRVGRDGLWLMPAGVLPPGTDSIPALTFERLAARMAELRASFDYVFLDAPPAIGDSVAAYLSSMADGVILIVERSFTPRQAARELKDEIEAAGGHVLGVVLHRRALPFSDRVNSSQRSPKKLQNS